MAWGDVFGPSVGPWTVEQAVLNLLQTPPADSAYPLVQYYIADQERVLGLAAQSLPVPPGPSSYQGGIDTDTMQAEWMPMFHVNVSTDGSPEYIDMLTLGQDWQITVTATVGNDDENTARACSRALATAATLLILQNGGLGIGATQTRLTTSPASKLLAPDARQVVQTSFTVATTTIPAFTRQGPGAFQASPYDDPGDWPAVSSVNVSVDEPEHGS